MNKQQFDIKPKWTSEASVFHKFSNLANITKSVNLGHGFPDWGPPEFFLDSFKKHLSGNNQYCPSKGIGRLQQNLANLYSKHYNRKLDPVNEILITNGAASALYTAFTALLVPEDEVITIEPFFDCYLPQTKFNFAKLVGLPLIPPKSCNRDSLKDISNFQFDSDNTWQFDFNLLEKLLNEKTRIIILNTPQNPTGKILSLEELEKIAKILQNFPRVVVIMDEVYEFNLFNKKSLPRMSNIENMWDRTISIHSGGKMFSITGVRVGWAIGSEKILKLMFPLFQYTHFCVHEPLQMAIADCIEEAEKEYKGSKTYYDWVTNQLLMCRNVLIGQIVNNSDIDVEVYVPEGGFFIICGLKGENKLSLSLRHPCLEGDQESQYGNDYKFLINLAWERKVVGIPGSAMMTPENRKKGENFVRFALCKKEETIKQAVTNLSNGSASGNGIGKDKNGLSMPRPKF